MTVASSSHKDVLKDFRGFLNEARSKAANGVYRDAILNYETALGLIHAHSNDGSNDQLSAAQSLLQEELSNVKRLESHWAFFPVAPGPNGASGVNQQAPDPNSLDAAFPSKQISNQQPNQPNGSGYPNASANDPFTQFANAKGIDQPANQQQDEQNQKQQSYPFGQKPFSDRDGRDPDVWPSPSAEPGRRRPAPRNNSGSNCGGGVRDSHDSLPSWAGSSGTRRPRNGNANQGRGSRDNSRDERGHDVIQGGGSRGSNKNSEDAIERRKAARRQYEKPWLRPAAVPDSAQGGGGGGGGAGNYDSEYAQHLYGDRGDGPDAELISMIERDCVEDCEEISFDDISGTNQVQVH